MGISHYRLTRLAVFSLGDDVGGVEEALSLFSLLTTANKLSSVEVILEVQSSSLSLKDQHNQVLEEFALSSLLRCDSLFSKVFSSLLLLVSQSFTHKRPTILFFSCAPVKAELIRDEIRRVVSDYTSRAKSMELHEIPGPPRTQAPHSLPPPYISITPNGVLNEEADKAFLRAQQEVDLLNHCFEDIEMFMGKLQQAAEAQSVLEQRNKKKKKSRKKNSEDDMLSAKAKAPPEAEFIQIFQKFKYSFSLLAKLKSAISSPTSEELLHHLFRPLDMIVKATGGPALAASVSSPALTSAAVDLLQNNLSLQEHTLWTSLGLYWTHPRLAFRGPIPSYSPNFMNGWRLPGSEVEGWVDPIELQHRKDAENQQLELQKTLQPAATPPPADQIDGVQERQYRCSYDFVARNSSELSVLQGDTLEVVESSKRWWKCRNRFNEVGFLPFNILEPITHIESPVSNKPPKAPAPPPLSKMTPLAPPTPRAGTPESRVLPPQHLPDDTEKVMQVNDELLKRLTNGKAALNRPLVIPRSSDTSVRLDYFSPPAEVEAWLRGKGFSDPTVQCLRVLNGAQLFSLNKEELRAVIPEEGARVYSQLTVQKSLLEDVKRASELEAVMEKQKMKVDFKAESGTL